MQQRLLGSSEMISNQNMEPEFAEEGSQDLGQEKQSRNLTQEFIGMTALLVVGKAARFLGSDGSNEHGQAGLCKVVTTSLNANDRSQNHNSQILRKLAHEEIQISQHI